MLTGRFQVKPGECLGIASPSGSGKPTVLKILESFAHPTEGQMLIDGKPC